MWVARATLLTAALVGASCGDNDLCGEGDDLPAVEVVNQTGMTIDEVVFVDCAGGTPIAFDLPPGGLRPGDTLRLDLPNAGCYRLRYVAGDCVSNRDHETGELCMDETDLWIVDEATLQCPD